MNVVVLEDVLEIHVFQENEPSELTIGGTLYAPAFVRHMSVEFTVPSKYEKMLDVSYDENIIWAKGYCLHGYLDSILEIDNYTIVTMVLLKEAFFMSLDEFRVEYFL